MSYFGASKNVKIIIAYTISLLCLIMAYKLDTSDEFKELIASYDSHLIFKFRPDFVAFFFGNLSIYLFYLIGICFPLLLTYFLIKKNK